MMRPSLGRIGIVNLPKIFVACFDHEIWHLHCKKYSWISTTAGSIELNLNDDFL